MPFTIFESPFGPLTLVAGADGLRGLYFPGKGPALAGLSGLAAEDPDPEVLVSAAEQLGQYFHGERRSFGLTLELRGTPFQQCVWRALQEIPYGTTTTYGALARQLASVFTSGTPQPRAVGAAVGATPIPIVIPCHRVIGSDGSLTGYGGGLQRKRALLDFEAAGGDRGAFDTAWRQRQLALL
jgi:methylated-DNA-[protein]-cysteine S-methyltransferase